MTATKIQANDRSIRLALIFGGRSGEHEVSVVSARSIHRALSGQRYEVVPMAIDRQGSWADVETASWVLADSGDSIDQVVSFEGHHRLDPRLLDGSFDVVFPVLHGPYGEDGTIQGLLEMLDLPYVGCDSTASAVCMDKILCKRLLTHADLATPAWQEVDRKTWIENRDQVIEACIGLGLPLFVKPVRLGSSVGISKVSDPAALPAALELALRHGRQALVEKGLAAREIEIAVLGDEHPRAAVPGEVVPGHDFYDYEDKYVDSACELLAPAPLDEETVRACQDLAMDVFRILGCSGMARVDLFLERDGGQLWVNEVNTIPGFTAISMYPRLWGLSGLDFPALLDELVRLALQRHQEYSEFGNQY
jgi:D-alanine-D-alanine ligase